MGTVVKPVKGRQMPEPTAATPYVPAGKVFAGLTLSRHTGDWLAAIIIIAVFVQFFVCFGDVAYYNENGQVELAQCALLGLAVILFAWAAMKMTDRLTVMRMFALSVFALTFLFREVEVKGTPLEPYLYFADQHHLKYVFLGVLWLALFLFSLRQLRASVVAMLRWLMTGPGKFLLAGIALYLVGDLAEKHLIVANPDLSRMIEESAETFGTLAIFLSAFAAFAKSRKPSRYPSAKALMS